MHNSAQHTSKSLRFRIAQEILSDAEKRAFGKVSRIERWVSALSLGALLIGFLLASQANTHTPGWIIFFAGFGFVLGVSIVGLLPAVQRMQARLARAGLEAAGEMRLPEILAAKWAINELVRQSKS